MTDLSLPLAHMLVAAGASTAILGAVAALRPGPVARRSADLAGVSSLALALVAWGGRWGAAGHLPVFGTYESALSLTVAVLVAAVVARRLWPGEAGIWPAGGAVAAALMAHGLRFSPEAYALTISERSWVVDVHAVVAWAAFGCLAANAGLALRHVASRTPAGPVAERALSASLSLGFALHSGMMASGSFYKFLLFGVAWSFDPIETLGIVAWLSYGTLLHMHLLGGWQGRRLAGWCLALFVVLAVSYRGIVYFPASSTYHIFDMDLRLHIGPGEPAR